MAGMFYSLQEVADKLNQTEEQVKELVREGKLREFRDGPNLLFKVDEVEALAPEATEDTVSDTAELSLADTTVLPAEQAPSGVVPFELESQPTEEQPQANEENPSGDDDTAELLPLEEEKLTDADTTALGDENIDLLADTPNDTEAIDDLLADTVAAPEPIEDLLADTTATPAPVDELLDDTATTAEQIDSLLADTAASEPSDDLLAETQVTAADTAASEPSDELLDDTATTAEQIDSLLADTAASKPSDDLLAETQVTAADTKGPSGETSILSADEASLEEIEDDVNLDTFGSGSGLLDLSLQADDTSLGGILDEIYTPTDDGAEPDSGGLATTMDLTSGSGQMIADADFATPQAAMEQQALAATYVEPAPDKSSNIFGIMLLLPFLAVLYTAVITISGFSNVMPGILKPVQGVIMYVLGGILALVVIMSIMGFAAGGTAGTKKPKVKKEKVKKAKKEKKPKAKKEKKKRLKKKKGK